MTTNFEKEQLSKNIGKAIRKIEKEIVNYSNEYIGLIHIYQNLDIKINITAEGNFNHYFKIKGRCTGEWIFTERVSQHRTKMSTKDLKEYSDQVVRDFFTIALQEVEIDGSIIHLVPTLQLKIPLI